MYSFIKHLNNHHKDTPQGVIGLKKRLFKLTYKMDLLLLELNAKSIKIDYCWKMVKEIKDELLNIDRVISGNPYRSVDECIFRYWLKELNILFNWFMISLHKGNRPDEQNINHLHDILYDKDN